MAPELSKIAEFLAAHEALSGRLVLAVSGGSDSMAMLELLARLDLTGPLLVAHHDHCQHPASEDDLAFVQERARAHDLPVLISHDPQLPPGSSEEALRRSRYDHLARSVLEAGGGVLLTAHTQDDQAETLLSRLVRGAGATGARGIAAHRSWPVSGGGRIEVLRPLLDFRRSHLRALLRGCGVPWREDPSNSDGSNLRSRLRRLVLPALEEALEGRDPVPALARFASVQAPIVDLLDALMPSEPDRATLAALAPALLDHWLHRQGVSTHGHVLAARRAITSGQPAAARDLPGGLRLEVDANEVRIRTAPSPLPSLPHLEVTHVGECPETLPPGSCYLASARTPQPLSVRRRIPGDRFRPLGGPGSRLLADFLADAGIPRRQRDEVPVVVTAAGDIAWVAPLRLDARFAASPGEGQVLSVRLLSQAPPDPATTGEE